MGDAAPEQIKSGNKIGGDNSQQNLAGGNEHDTHSQGPPVAAVAVPAISVIDGHKSYQKGNPIIKNFTMTVPANTIYALLGSSGCGKTTMLSCCVGLKQLDAGEVKVYGYTPGTKKSGVPGRRVGYMPQDLSLYDELTIEEHLMFYGRVYGMTEAQIHEQTEFLLNLLDLPKPHRKVRTLSGGQQRRASMAVTLVHDPELLILDEPTVGVDPLLRESIWKHVVSLVAGGRTTVIVTTHYIDEARMAHNVGIMRNGRLLTENPPDVLLKLYKTDNLEEVLLILCRKDHNDREEEKRKTLANASEPGTESEWTLKTVVTKPNEVSPAPEPKMIESPPAPAADASAPAGGGMEVVPMTKDASPVANGEGHGGERRGSIRDQLEEKRLFKMKFTRVGALLKKDGTLLKRNIGFLVFLFMVPSLQVLLSCLIVGTEPQRIPIGAVIPWGSKTKCDDPPYDQCPLAGIAGRGEEDDKIPCTYIEKMKNQTTSGLVMQPIVSVDPKHIVSTIDAAEKLLNDGLIVAYFQFAPTFSDSFECRTFPLPPANPSCNIFFDKAKFDQTHPYNPYKDDLCMKQHVQPRQKDMDIERIMKNSLISVKIDMADSYMGLIIQKMAMIGLRETLLVFHDKCPNKSPTMEGYKYSGDFIKIDLINENQGYKGYLTPGVLLGLLFFFPLCSSSVAYITERKSGTLERMMVAGVTAGEFMGAFLVTQCVLLIGQSSIAFLILFLFKIRIKNAFTVYFNAFFTILLANLVGLSGMSAGFCLAMVCKDEVQAVLAAIGIFFPNILLSGMIVPIELAEFVLPFKIIAAFVPCTYAIDALRCMMGRGWSIISIRVFTGFATTIGWIIFYIFLALIIHKKQSKK